MTDLPTRFYTAFAALDDDGMNACYAPEATFKDPIFDLGNAAEIHKMWSSLCKAAKGFELTFQVGDVSDTQATATWQASYDFSATGRRVHNKISSTMDLKDGLIVAQRDEFNFHIWAKQAIGPMGLLFGWAPVFQRKVAGQARRGLRL